MTQTKQKMQALGYVFDSTDYELTAPFQVEGMWEFPISLMDVSVIGWGKKDMAVIKEKTLEYVEAAKEKQLPYFVLNFHDIYFSETYPFHYQWYQWLIQYFKEQNHEFINFKQAIVELESCIKAI